VVEAGFITLIARFLQVFEQHSNPFSLSLTLSLFHSFILSLSLTHTNSLSHLSLLTLTLSRQVVEAGFITLMARFLQVFERFVVDCQTTSVSAAHATHCATYCTPCRPLTRALSR